MKRRLIGARIEAFVAGVNSLEHQGRGYRYSNSGVLQAAFVAGRRSKEVAQLEQIELFLGLAHHDASRGGA